MTEPVPVESGTTTVSTTTPGGGGSVATVAAAGGLGTYLAMLTVFALIGDDGSILGKPEEWIPGVQAALAGVYGALIAGLRSWWQQRKRATSTTTTTTVPAGAVVISAPPADDVGVT